MIKKKPKSGKIPLYRTKKRHTGRGPRRALRVPLMPPPLAPFELQSASTNRVLGGGVCKALPRTPSALLCFDFSLRLEAIGCSVVSAPNPKSLWALLVVVAVISQYGKEFSFLHHDSEGAPPRRGRGGRA